MPDKWRFPIDRRIAILANMGFATIVIFVLGIGNFALNRAVFNSDHPLFFALLLSVQGWPGFVWAYCGYSAVNALAGWLLLSGRV
jgi:hypothetical protein